MGPRSQAYCGVEPRLVSRWSQVVLYPLSLHYAASQFYEFKISEVLYLLVCFVSISVAIIGFGAMATAATVMLLACQFSGMAGHVNDG